MSFKEDNSHKTVFKLDSRSGYMSSSYEITRINSEFERQHIKDENQDLRDVIIYPYQLDDIIYHGFKVIISDVCDIDILKEVTAL